MRVPGIRDLRGQVRLVLARASLYLTFALAYPFSLRSSKAHLCGGPFKVDNRKI